MDSMTVGGVTGSQVESQVDMSHTKLLQLMTNTIKCNCNT